MKTLKKIMCLLLTVCTICTLCACGGRQSDEAKENTPEEKVRSAVTVRGKLAYYGSTIGGNELKSSDATITTVNKISDTEYRVSGKIVMTDIYGTKWSNTFDCKVTKIGDSWSAASFEYKSSSWSKG